ncbi:MAG: FAD binding domain-containing protein, partial [Myxococcota bacterium]
TVEGLRGDGVHPVQEALVQKLGSQCGYCTPGIIMSMFEACYRTDLDASWKLDDQMCGNLCRCTGYRPIREATEAIAGQRPDDRFTAALGDAAEPQPNLAYQSDTARGAQGFWIPTSWSSLFEVTAAQPDHRFVVGATDLGLHVTKHGKHYDALISLQGLDELRTLEIADGRWSVGATVKLADLEDATDHALPPLSRMLRFFGSRQIKNSATVGGNLCNASPIGDLAPVMLALDATMIARGPDGERAIGIDDFYTGYRETDLQPGELLARVEFDAPAHGERFVSYKVSKRREMDISAVSAALRVRLHDDGTVAAARFGFGGMAATPARAEAAEAAVLGKPWSQATCDAAADALNFTPMSDHRGSAWYRRTVAANLLRGFFADVADDPMPRLPDRPTGTVFGSLPQVRA